MTREWHPMLITEPTPGVLEIWFETRLVGRIPSNALNSLLRAAHNYKTQARDRKKKK